MMMKYLYVHKDVLDNFKQNYVLNVMDSADIEYAVVLDKLGFSRYFYISVEGFYAIGRFMVMGFPLDVVYAVNQDTMSVWSEGKQVWQGSTQDIMLMSSREKLVEYLSYVLSQIVNQGTNWPGTDQASPWTG